MHKAISGFGCAVILGTASTSWAAVGVIVSEDFESYADTAAMSAVWQGIDGELRTAIDDNLDGIPEETGKFAFHPGGNTNIYNLPNSISATETEWIRLSVDIYDNDTSLDPFFPLNPFNKRMTLGLRSSAPANIIELGMFNNMPEAHFMYRAILFDSINSTPNPNWDGWDLGTEVVGPDSLPVNRFRGAGWHRWIVTIKPESLVFEFDLDRDGTIDGTDVYFDIAHTSFPGFNQLRFGGPSGVTSGGGGVHFDNILLEIIPAPEPATFGLFTFGGLALLRRR
ncbi:MAG: PEP-CTERM sorting domain-containing protein [Phycisphaerales bacterium]